ncbi:polyphosphate--glucose phosphotransferase [Mumia zhuanghuii]|uniref:ROK family protein n=1 Tax=Mumia zhuanghuii TaxID=2585211 RepID=A0A5C4MRX0_9ACTN|nr:ROK family protein [Mumia zhuanghuii]TNC39069.1 ROK family protein [Mumia zhuanghuii]TNC47097.1 ROK family protein [Mumia zhuanghuii]
MAKQTHPIGVDIGGSGVKGAPVDLSKGEFAEDRLRIETPRPSTPDAVAEVVAEIVDHFAPSKGTPVGVTVPAVVTRGLVRTAANIDRSWIGTDAENLLTERLGRPVAVINDADAAGIGELEYGAGRGTTGLVVMTTLGTGIGTALINNGVLVPNSELGHLEIDGGDAEKSASSAARENEDLSWEEWAERLQVYYARLEDLLWPDLVIVGGGVAKHADKYLPLLHLRAPIVAARLGNAAGIIGAGVLAAQAHA